MCRIDGAAREGVTSLAVRLEGQNGLIEDIARQATPLEEGLGISVAWFRERHAKQESILGQDVHD